jgi:hypothetical protein
MTPSFVRIVSYGYRHTNREWNQCIVEVYIQLQSLWYKNIDIV